MMKLRETVGAAVVMGALFAALCGRQKQEGPAERADKEVDKAGIRVVKYEDTRSPDIGF